MNSGREQTRASFSIADTNVTKGIAILLMMLHHCFSGSSRYQGYTIDFRPFTEAQMQRLAGYGKVCVPIFVFLTAYGITVSLQKAQKKGYGGWKDTGRMVLRRIWKLYAGFWFAYLLTVVGCVLWSPERFRIYRTGWESVRNVVLDILCVTVYTGTPKLIYTWWYMSLALLEILLIPVMLFLYGYIKGPGLVLLCLAVSRILHLNVLASASFNYILVMALGIWAADRNLPGRFRAWKQGEVKWEFLKMILAADLVFLTAWLYRYSFWKGYEDIRYALCTLAVVFFVAQVAARIPGIREILAFFGKYSMNVFLIHSAIRGIWLKDFLYSMGEWWQIVIVLYGISLAVSVVMELVKKGIRYDRLVEMVSGRLFGKSAGAARSARSQKK